MEIGWGNGNQEMKGFWMAKMYEGKKMRVCGEINYKETWFIYTPGNKSKHLKCKCKINQGKSLNTDIALFCVCV